MKPHALIVDTNVVIAGLLSSGKDSPVSRILDAMLDGRLLFLLSPALLAEYRQVLLRPIRPEDEPRHHEFISRLTPEDIRFRFFGQVKSLPHSEMAKLTNDW